jgi:dienelactone hydrolase
MALTREEFRYEAGEKTCIGTLSFDDSWDTPRPAVMIAPSFRGISDLDRDWADHYVALWYVGVAIDYYGDGTSVQTMEEASALMAVVNNDRPLFLRRMEGALAAVSADARVDDTRIAALGFCLGGKAVLDLARSGAKLAATVPIHGVLDAPPAGSVRMNTTVMLLHGWDDPLATPAQLEACAQELTEHCDDWQVLGFGNTGHAFTNPGAAGAGMGFSQTANDRSKAIISALLAEKFTET